MRPLSNINLAINRSPGAGGEFDPESAGTLTAWYDVSDPDNRTVTSGTPDLLTRLDNKAAADASNDAQMSDGIGGTGAPAFLTASINGLDTGECNDSPQRAMAVTDNTQTFTKVGSGGFRVFLVLQKHTSATQECIPFQNGANDPSGGGYAFHMNRAADGSGTIRFQMYDGSTSGHAVANLVVSDANNDVNDGNPHVIMLGRSVGTGSGGVDQLVAAVDGTDVVGSPVDLDASFGDADNDGSTNAAAGWLIMGAAAAAPNLAQRWADVEYCEILLYKTDMTAGQEAAVVNYLKSKWGVA